MKNKAETLEKLRISVVRDDGLVVVNGEGYSGIDMKKVPAFIHAIQWHGQYGFLEIVDNDHEDDFFIIDSIRINSFKDYDFLLDLWAEKRDKADSEKRKQADHEKRIEAENKKLQKKIEEENRAAKEKVEKQIEADAIIFKEKMDKEAAKIKEETELRAKELNVEPSNE
jgi:flagellar biosynthesis GTPase FlhF